MNKIISDYILFILLVFFSERRKKSTPHIAVAIGRESLVQRHSVNYFDTLRAKWWNSTQCHIISKWENEDNLSIIIPQDAVELQV